MINLLFENPALFAIAVLGLVVAITIHEFAHAYAADKLGDPTPRLQGRVTLNPAKHLDPFGSLFILLVGFGWGRPVQFDPFNLENVRRDSAIISFAGPLSNLLLAAVIGLGSWLLGLGQPLPDLVASVLYLVIYTNVGLAVFNMIPVHPLDGFKIVEGLLPEDQAREWRGLERYGFFFLILLMIPLGNASMISTVIRPVTTFLTGLFAGHLTGF
jgi:Zn-dependent protease